MLNDVEFCESLLLVLSRWLIRPIGRLYEAFLQLLSIIQHDHCRRDDHDNRRRDDQDHCRMKDKRQRKSKAVEKLKRGRCRALLFLKSSLLILWHSTMILSNDYDNCGRYFDQN